MKYREQDYMIQEEEDVILEDTPASLRSINEIVRVLQDEEVELINIPIPEFGDSDPADIVHDFKLVRNTTDTVNKCTQNNSNNYCKHTDNT